MPPRSPSPLYFLVLGYSTGWTVRYAAYLDTVAAHYRRRDPSRLVLCGGVTGKPSTEISEAEWMARQLEQRGVPRDRLELEERSRTTLENFACAHDQGLLPPDGPAVIFCDSYRRLKVRALARCFRLERYELVHVPIEVASMGLAVRLKSLFDATRLLLLGLPERQQ